MRGRGGMARLGILKLFLTAGCEALWGGLSVPAAENCVTSGNPCQTGQICNQITKLCQDELVVSQITPPRAPTDAVTPITISGANFMPGMRVKWNGSELQPVTVDSPTALRVTAPASPDGSWLVTVEVTNPSGLTVGRRDLFSYYANSVSLKVTTPPVPGYQGLSAIRTAALLTANTGGVIMASGTGQLRAVSVSSDGQSLSELRTLVGPINAGSLLVRDLNGDGVRDLLLGSGQGFYWLAGNADLSFQSNQPLHPGVIAGASIALGELDQSGRPDLVGVNTQNNQVAVLRDAGTLYSEIPVGAATINNVTVAELDGKPGDEIAVAYRGSADHFSLIFGGAGAPADISLAPCLDSRLQAGRFTAAPSSDLLLCCADRVQLLANTGGSSFKPGATFTIAQPSGQLVGTPAIADFDGDGDLDIVLLQLPMTGATQADLYLLENSDGRGTMTMRLLPGSAAVPANALLDAGDVNNDGKPDVVIGNRLSSATVPLTVLLNLSR